jgi:hypothetical protein
MASASSAGPQGLRPRASSGRSPAPIPRIARPADTSSSVAAATAVIAGCLVTGLVTAVPSRSLELLLAARVRYTQLLRACREESVSQR